MGPPVNEMGPIVKLRASFLSGLQFKGRVNRYVKYRKTDTDDKYFIKFMADEYKINAYDDLQAYQKVKCNYEALMPSLLKYDRLKYTYDYDIWSEVTEWCIQHFSCMSNSNIWSLDYCISMMEGKSSPGYPFSLLYKTKNKLFEDKEIRPYLEYFTNEIKVRQMPVMWAVNEKDEMREAAKVSVNRIRTFVGSPVDLLSSMMELFGDMNEKMYSTANKLHWSFVGATKFYGGWHELARRLLKHMNGFELDETDYDCSLDSFMLRTCALIRSHMYNPKNFSSSKDFIKLRRWIDNVYTEIIHSYMVCPGGDILLKDGGNPSGSFNTITDNVLVLYCLLAFAWKVLVPEGFNTFINFHKHVEATLCGDDNTWSVSNEYVKYYNAESVSLIWSQMGIKTKTDFYHPRIPTDCWFMSSGFKCVPHPLTGADWFVPVPETSKVLSSIAFNNKGRSARWSLLRAAALRIESFWNDECRMHLWQYINYLKENYMSELLSPKNFNDPLDIFTYEEVCCVIKSDVEILELYLEKS